MIATLAALAYLAVGFALGAADVRALEAHLRHKYPRVTPTETPIEDAIYIGVLWGMCWPIVLVAKFLLGPHLERYCERCGGYFP